MPERIDDPGDGRIADYQRTGDAAGLRDLGLFIAEGRLVVERLIESRRFTIRSILVTPAAFAALEPLLASVPCPVYVAPGDVMETLTGFDFHRGSLALAERPPALDLPSLVDGSTRILVMEGVGNPDNVGGLFRVAEAFGANAVLLDPGSADPLYRKSIRTSMASVLRVPFGRVASWPEGLEAIRLEGFTIVALTPHASTIPLDEYSRSASLSARLVVMVGAEGGGLSDAALRIADAKVRIPLAAGVDSLNVVVAAGIALSSLTRRA